MPSVAKTRVLPSETVITWSAPPLVFGRGAFDELGHHAAALGLRRVALVTDPHQGRSTHQGGRSRPFWGLRWRVYGLRAVSKVTYRSRPFAEQVNRRSWPFVDRIRAS